MLLADLDEKRLVEVAKIESDGGRATTCVTDVRQWASVQAMADSCIEAFGGIDFAIANAGVGSYSSLNTANPELWRRVVETNLLGVLHTVRAVYPQMKERRSGHRSS